MAVVEFGPDAIIYSDGTIARSTPVKVYVTGSNTLASLYSEYTGTIVQSNPVSTDSQGNLRFFTAAGTYDLEVNGFRVTVTITDPLVVASGFAWNQTSPSAQWNIPHALGRVPAVEVYVAGKLIGVDVDATNTNVVVTFPSPQSGVAVLV